MAHPLWRHMLDESKRQAVKAMDEYNSSHGTYADFIGQMVRAWLFLLHAEFRKGKIDYHHVDPATGKYVIIDGEPKAWELGTCLKQRFVDPQDPVRKNIEFFIPLRNKIEHRFQREIQMVTGGRAHALVINYEAELVAHFGQQYSLGDRLRFPIFLQSVPGTDVEEVRRLQKRVPKSMNSYLTEFESTLSPSLLEDVRYDYRVRLIPITGPKTDADLAVNFVDMAKLTDEEKAMLLDAGRQGNVITKIKQVDVSSKDKMLPGGVVARVNDRVLYKFTLDHHVRLWKHFKVRPLSTAGDRTVTDPRYCVWDEPHQGYIYTPAWVEKITKEVGTIEKATAFFGKAPATKVINLDDVRDRKASRDDDASELRGRTSD